MSLRPRFDISVKRALKAAKISTYRLRQISPYDGKYFEIWRTADPTAATLKELADLCDCTVDYLVGIEN